MPVLHQKKDGGYYIQGYVHDMKSVCTWQVTQKGVKSLRRRGINEDDEFPTYILCELIDRGYAFTRNPGSKQRHARVAPPAPGAG